MSENGPNGFPLPENLGMDTKIKSLACSEQKLQIWPFCHILVVMNGHKWRFGHSGQSEVSENGPNGFPMPKNLGIDTKIKSLAGSEQKLQIWPFCHSLVAINDDLATFGHPGQSGTSENGPNGFPMPENLGMDTKIKSLALSKPKLHFVAIFGVLGAKFGPPRLFFFIFFGAQTCFWPIF